MKKLIFYLSCTDDQGNPFGLKADLGAELKQDSLYEAVTASTDLSKLLEAIGVADYIPPERAKFITREEYNRDFGENEEEENNAE